MFSKFFKVNFEDFAVTFFSSGATLAWKIILIRENCKTVVSKSSLASLPENARHLAENTHEFCFGPLQI